MYVCIYLFHYNKNVFVFWSCTLCVLSFNLYVLVLAPLFCVLNLNLNLYPFDICFHGFYAHDIQHLDLNLSEIKTCQYNLQKMILKMGKPILR